MPTAMTQAKFESGLSTALDVQQSRQTVESTRAGIPSNHCIESRLWRH